MQGLQHHWNWNHITEVWVLLPLTASDVTYAVLDEATKGAADVEVAYVAVCGAGAGNAN